MNKTITALALLASASASNAFAMLLPPDAEPNPPMPNYCVSLYTSDKGVSEAGDCDKTEENKELKAPLLDNGCAEGQASIRSREIVIPACTNIVQL